MYEPISQVRMMVLVFIRMTFSIDWHYLFKLNELEIILLGLFLESSLVVQRTLLRIRSYPIHFLSILRIISSYHLNSSLPRQKKISTHYRFLVLRDDDGFAKSALFPCFLFKFSPETSLPMFRYGE